jgi:hypothetical protein
MLPSTHPKIRNRRRAAFRQLITTRDRQKCETREVYGMLRLPAALHSALSPRNVGVWMSLWRWNSVNQGGYRNSLGPWT